MEKIKIKFDFRNLHLDVYAGSQKNIYKSESYQNTWIRIHTLAE